MVEHYYSQQPSAASERHMIEETLRGKKYMFITDAGVFSRRGVDFGSRLLIETMEIRESDNVLDVGCGYGPIGIVAAALALKGTVTMVDINERAVEIARANADRSGMDNVRVIRSDQFEALGDEVFDVILTNPPIRAGKQVVFGIFEGARERLREGGSLWVVIQKKQGAPSAAAKLESLFGDVREVTKEKGYRILKAIKQKC